MNYDPGLAVLTDTSSDGAFFILVPETGNVPMMLPTPVFDPPQTMQFLLNPSAHTYEGQIYKEDSDWDTEQVCYVQDCLDMMSDNTITISNTEDETSQIDLSNCQPHVPVQHNLEDFLLTQNEIADSVRREEDALSDCSDLDIEPCRLIKNVPLHVIEHNYSIISKLSIDQALFPRLQVTQQVFPQPIPQIMPQIFATRGLNQQAFLSFCQQISSVSYMPITAIPKKKRQRRTGRPRGRPYIVDPVTGQPLDLLKKRERLRLQNKKASERYRERRRVESKRTVTNEFSPSDGNVEQNFYLVDATQKDGWCQPTAQ